MNWSIVHMDFVWINNKQIYSSISEYFFPHKKKILHTWNLQKFKDYSTQNASKTQSLNSLSADLSLRCRDAGHLSFGHMFLWCSFTSNVWSHGINERNQNNSGAKALRILILFEGPRCNYQWRHNISRNGYLPDCPPNCLFFFSFYRPLWF